MVSFCTVFVKYMTEYKEEHQRAYGVIVKYEMCIEHFL